MKKKLVTLALTCAMAMLLAACGSKDGKEAPTPTEAVKPTEMAASTVTPVVNPTDTPEPTATSAPKVADTYKKGTLTDTGWESEWMNLRFTTPDGATMMSQAELDALMKQSANMMYGDNAEEMLDYAKLAMVFEMLAKYDNGANVLIQVEILSALYEGLTEEEYLAIVLTNMKNNAGGITTESDGTTYNVEIGGEKYTGVSCATDYGTGVPVYQEYLVRKIGNRMISFVVTCTEETVDDAATLVNMFTAYDEAPAVAPTKAPAATATPKPKVTQKPTATPAPVVSEDGFNVGTLNKNVYENKWMGLKFTAPEDATVKNLSQSADMVWLEATWAEGVPLVQILAEQAYYENMTAEEYMEALKSDLEGLAASGMDYVFAEDLAVVEIAGQEYVKLSSSVDYMGIQMYQDYCVREQDGYMVSIVFTYADGFETGLQEAEAAFTAY